MNKSREADAAPDDAAIKQKQGAVWASGDYARIGATLYIMGENLTEAMDIRAGQNSGVNTTTSVIALPTTGWMFFVSIMYGSFHKGFEALDPAAQDSLEQGKFHYYLCRFHIFKQT